MRRTRASRSAERAVAVQGRIAVAAQASAGTQEAAGPVCQIGPARRDPGRRSGPASRRRAVQRRPAGAAALPLDRAVTTAKSKLEIKRNGHHLNTSGTFGPDMVSEAEEQVRVIQENLKIAQSPIPVEKLCGQETSIDLVPSGRSCLFTGISNERSPTVRCEGKARPSLCWAFSPPN